MAVCNVSWGMCDENPNRPNKHECKTDHYLYPPIHRCTYCDTRKDG